jgi:hypothetical protein
MSPPPGDVGREKERREVIDQLRHTIELVKRESAEQTQAIASLKNGLELLQIGRKYEQKEITDLIARLTADVQAVTQWRHASYRDMWEGDKSFAARLKDMEREVARRHEDLQAELKSIRAARQEFREEVIAKFDESEKKMDVIDKAISGGKLALRSERVKAGAAIVAATVTSLLAAVAAVAIALIK